MAFCTGAVYLVYHDTDITKQYTTEQHSTVKCIAVQCRAGQYSAVQ